MSGIRGRPPAIMLALLPALLVGALAAAVFINGPPPAHTGGFGEPTCASCHFDVPEADPAGSLSIDGLPETITPGARYLLSVSLQRPGMRRGGFEMAARYAAGAARGNQAGTLRGTSERVAVTTHGGTDYAHHTAAGIDMSAENAASWQVEWTAPADPAGPVVFHLAGNASDGDESQFGDHVYTATATVDAGKGAERR